MTNRIASTGGILVDKASKANTTDMQSGTFDFDELKVTWQHRSRGNPPDLKYPWGTTFCGDKGTLRASVHSYDFNGGSAVYRDVTYELERYHKDKTGNAIKLGRILKRDAAKQRVKGDEQVYALLHRTCRKPWAHPDPEQV